MKWLFTLFFIPLIAAAHPGTGIVVDSRGNVFYTDLSQVWKINPSGTRSIVVPNVHTQELYMDHGDNLYGEHLWYNGEQLNTWGYCVWKLNAGGKLEKVVPDSEGFRENYSFVQDHMGNMFMADGSSSCQRVIRKSAQGSKLLSDECFHNIRQMKVLADGTLALVDFQDVYTVGSDGRTKLIAARVADKDAAAGTAQNSVFGIWGDNNGNIYTAVYSLNLIKKFTSDGSESTVYKSSWPWAPTGGLVSGDGALWVLETNLMNAVRVVRVAPSGERRVYQEF